jgi:polysaccharide export outer membrane protein
MRPSQLKASLEEKLREYLTEPNVTVIVDQIRHYRIYVTGKVQAPSSFILEKPITVLQAISLAGGLQEFANESDVKIVRSTPQGYSYLDFDYKEIIRGRNVNQNIYLESGDVVVVP